MQARQVLESIASITAVDLAKTKLAIQFIDQDKHFAFLSQAHKLLALKEVLPAAVMRVVEKLKVCRDISMTDLPINSPLLLPAFSVKMRVLGEILAPLVFLKQIRKLQPWADLIGSVNHERLVNAEHEKIEAELRLEVQKQDQIIQVNTLVLQSMNRRKLPDEPLEHFPGAARVFSIKADAETAKLHAQARLNALITANQAKQCEHIREAMVNAYREQKQLGEAVDAAQEILEKQILQAVVEHLGNYQRCLHDVIAAALPKELANFSVPNVCDDSHDVSTKPASQYVPVDDDDHYIYICEQMRRQSSVAAASQPSQSVTSTANSEKKAGIAVIAKGIYDGQSTLFPAIKTSHDYLFKLFHFLTLQQEALIETTKPAIEVARSLLQSLEDYQSLLSQDPEVGSLFKLMSDIGQCFEFGGSEAARLSNANPHRLYARKKPVSQQGDAAAIASRFMP